MPLFPWLQSDKVRISLATKLLNFLSEVIIAPVLEFENSFAVAKRETNY